MNKLASLFRFFVVFGLLFCGSSLVFGAKRAVLPLQNQSAWALVGESLFVSYRPLLKEFEINVGSKNIHEVQIQINGDDVIVEKFQLLGSGPFYSANQEELTGIYRNGSTKLLKLPLFYRDLRRVRIEIEKLQQTDELVQIQVWGR